MEIPEYQDHKLGIEARKTIAKTKTYRVRHGNGEAGSVLGQKYQDEMIYYTPTNPQTATQQLWRTVLRAGVWKWSEMTPEEKAPWIEEAKKYRNWSGYNTFISAWLKGLWKEEEMRVPNYDGGWISMGKGAIETLTHNVGGDPNDYLVVLTARSEIRGINIMFIGGDRFDTYRRGFDYRDLSNTTITIKRFLTDEYAPEIKVRIWRYA